MLPALRISPKCRFYYADLSFPQRDGAKDYYYTGGYFGSVYLKQGKVTAMAMNGGD